MRISDWSSDVCASDLQHRIGIGVFAGEHCRDGGGQVGPVALAARGDELHPAIGVVAGASELFDDMRDARRLRRRDRGPASGGARRERPCRSEEHTSELQSLMRISYAVFCLKKKTIDRSKQHTRQITNMSKHTT